MKNAIHLAQHVTYVDFADDLQKQCQAQTLFCSSPSETLQHITNSVDPELKSLFGACIKGVQRFKYLRTHIIVSQNDMINAEGTSLGCLQQV